MSYGIHWFRRDLRVAGNPGLQWSWEEHKGKVLGIYCFDKKFLARSDFSANRFQFYLGALAALQDELRALGGDLLVLDVGPREAFSELFAQMNDSGLEVPATVSWNRDYEPFARDRDTFMEKWFRDSGIAPHHERDHVLIEPHEIYKDEDPTSSYQIYSPYKRRWLDLFQTPEVQRRLELQWRGIQYLDKSAKKMPAPFFSLTWKEILKSKIKAPDNLKKYQEENATAVTIPIPAAGSRAALGWVRKFKDKIDDYGNTRDIPGVNGTSGFSIYFKNGSLTVPQVIADLNLKAFDKKDDSGRAKFLSELIWREFYYYILARFPHVEKKAFLLKYQNLGWKNSKAHFQAWKEGRTGYPLIDAGMRQLNTTGWMHNRVRMVVASFLTKDLLIDYRWGEQYFMEKLLDGDLAPNNGGWQWAASTGCDPQPYFRIFNPKLQSEKFDPKGNYIRKYVPELAALSDKEIHEPPAHLRGKHYPLPIVDHSTQKQAALKMFADARA